MRQGRLVPYSRDELTCRTETRTFGWARLCRPFRSPARSCGPWLCCPCWPLLWTLLACFGERPPLSLAFLCELVCHWADGGHCTQDFCEIQGHDSLPCADVTDLFFQSASVGRRWRLVLASCRRAALSKVLVIYFCWSYQYSVLVAVFPSVQQNF